MGFGVLYFNTFFVLGSYYHYLYQKSIHFFFRVYSKEWALGRVGWGFGYSGDSWASKQLRRVRALEKKALSLGLGSLRVSRV